MSGILLPPGVELPPESAWQQQCTQPELEHANNIARWMQAWPKPDEKPLALGDLMDVVLQHARTYLWQRDAADRVFAAACKFLGFDEPLKALMEKHGVTERPLLDTAVALRGATMPANRQQRRARLRVESRHEPSA